MGCIFCWRHPDERDRLIDSPNLGHSAIEELLRYESPVQWQTRMALEDIEVSGHPIPRGNRIFLMLGAANRDPRQFADPDRLDIARQNNRHLAFGQGTHYCGGAALGRLEALVAIRTTFTRFPRLRLASATPEWFENSVLRGRKRLPLSLT